MDRHPLILGTIVICFSLLTAFTFTAIPTTSAPHLPAALTSTVDSEPATISATIRLNPSFERVVNLGVPVGNAAGPQHLAFDSTAELLYILSEGVPILAQGNGLSVYDTARGEFVDHAKVELGQNPPLDLQFDATIGLLYVLQQKPFDSLNPTNLAVVDSNSLQTVQTLTDIDVMAAADSRLYTVGSNQLVVYNFNGISLVEQTRLNLPPTTEISAMAVNLGRNRLYLARLDNIGWGVDVLAADTLAVVGRVPMQDRIVVLVPDPATSQLLAVEEQGNDRWLYRLGADGFTLEEPYRFAKAFSGKGLTLSADGSQLFFSNNELPAPPPNPNFETLPTLSGLTTAELIPEYNIPLLTTVDDIVVDSRRNRVYAVTPFENLLYMVDLAESTVEQIPTAIDLIDVVVDEVAGELFVLDSRRHIRRLDATSLQLIAETQLERAEGDTGPGPSALTLDKTRDRLYVSGLPAFVLEADTLSQIERFDPGGQFTIAPNASELYLSNCGVAVLDARSLISQTVLPGSTKRDDQLTPNPCVSETALDATNDLLYGGAPNGVPGSNSGNLLYIYDLSAEPSLIYTGSELSVEQVVPDPANQQAFVRQFQGSLGRLRSLSLTPTTATATATVRYTHQLGLNSSDALYQAESRRLYVTDQDRLLVIAADSLDVIGEMPLPPDYDYRPVALDTGASRLYLAGNDGRLLLVKAEDGASRAENLSALAQAGSSVINPPQVPNGSILELALLPNDNILARIETDYDFQQDFRLYLTADEGQSWTDLSQSLPPSLQIQSIGVMANETLTPTLFVALHDARGLTGGLYRSTDGRQSWSAVMNGLRDLVVNRLVMPSTASDPSVIFANTLHGGLHYSLDAGQRWFSMSDIDPNESPPVLADSSAALASGTDGAKNNVLASRLVADKNFLGDNTGLFRTVIGPTGVSDAWQEVLDFSLKSLTLAPDGQTALGFFNNGLWRSDDGGLTWAPAGAGLTQLDTTSPSHILFSANFDRDQTAYIFFQNIQPDASGLLYRSTDAGLTWQIWDNPPASKRFTTVTLTPDDDFLFGDDAAQLTRLAADRLTWVDGSVIPDASASGATPPITIDDLAISPTFAQDQTLFAVQDLAGLFTSMDGGQSWRATPFPVRSPNFDGYRIAISPAFAQDQTLYVATGTSLQRSTDAGQSWQNLRLGSPVISFKAEQITLSPDFAQDDTLLAGTPDGVYRSTDRGDSWQQVQARPETAGRVRILSFSPLSGSAYAWFDFDSSLYVSNNGGLRWQAKAGPAGESFSIVTAAIGRNDLLVLRPDFQPQLLLVEGQGQSRLALNDLFPTEISTINALAYTPDGRTLLAGGAGGLLRSTDDGQSWQFIALENVANPVVTLIRATDDDYVVGLNSGQILYSDDAGTSWQDISVVR